MVSRRSRTSSTLLFEAASISMMFMFRPSSKDKHDTHFLHGSDGSSRSSDGVVQLIAFATMRAAVVFPTPRGPVNI